jgi:hypothetical protein
VPAGRFGARIFVAALRGAEAAPDRAAWLDTVLLLDSGSDRRGGTSVEA